MLLIALTPYALGQVAGECVGRPGSATVPSASEAGRETERGVGHVSTTTTIAVPATCLPSETPLFLPVFPVTLTHADVTSAPSYVPATGIAPVTVWQHVTVLGTAVPTAGRRVRVFATDAAVAAVLGHKRNGSARMSRFRDLDPPV